MNEPMNYLGAQLKMREGKKVRRKAWPDGKVAYFDHDGDGVPDELPVDSPRFVNQSQANYEYFLAHIRVDGGSASDENNRPFVTQEDSLKTDWEVLEVQYI